MSRREILKDPVFWGVSLAILIRAAFLFETRPDPLFSLHAIDARSYVDLATRFAAGDFLFRPEPLWFPAIYLILLGLWSQWFGSQWLGFRVLQLALGAVGVGLSIHLAKGFSSGAGWLVLGLSLLFAPTIVYENQLLLTVWGTLGVGAFVAIAPGAIVRGGRWVIASGAVLGLLALFRTNALVLAVVPLLFWARSRAWGRIAIFLTAVALVLSPLAIRNGVVASHWSPLSVNGGMMFASGFGSEAQPGRSGLVQPADFGPGGRFQREASEANGRAVSLAEASAYHGAQARRWISENPGAALALIASRARLLLSSAEVGDQISTDVLAPRSRVLSVLFVPWGVVLGFAVLGAGWGWGAFPKRRVTLVVCGATAIVYLATLLAFVGSTRYRVPVLVPLLVLAGLVAPSWGWARTHWSNWRVWVPTLLALVVAGASFSDSRVRPDRALQDLAIGAALQDQGRPQEALSFLDAALERSPALAAGHHNRALSLHALGRLDEAIAAARRATELDDDLASAWKSHGAFLAERGRVGEAVRSFERAVELLPNDASALTNLAQAYAVTGRVAEAMGVAQRAEALGVVGLEARLRALIGTGE